MATTEATTIEETTTGPETTTLVTTDAATTSAKTAALGEVCAADSECLTTDAECSTTCKCKAGYVQNGNVCEIQTTTAPTTANIEETTTASVPTIKSVTLSDDGTPTKPISTDVELTLEGDDLTLATCYLWDFDDGTVILQGDESECATSKTVSSVETFPTGSNTIKKVHQWKTQGSYEVNVEVWNEFSKVIAKKTIQIYDESTECSFPVVSILSVGATPDTARPVRLDKSQLVMSDIFADCDPVRKLNTHWSVHAYDPTSADPASLYEATASTQLSIPAHTLQFGINEIRLKVNPVGLDEVSTTARGYLNVEQAELVAIISGGTGRTVPSDIALKVDGSESIDPDVTSGDSSLTYTWYCRKHSDLLGVEDDDEDAWATSPVCFKDQATTELTDQKVVTWSVDPEQLKESDSYVMMLKVTKDTRITRAYQRIDVLSAGANSVSIRCLSNCGRAIIADKELKLVAECTSCASKAEPLDYSWQLYRRVGSEYQLVPDFAVWTTTGTTQRYLAMKEGVFQDGEYYSVRLVQKESSATYDFSINLPPVGGICSPNLYVGHGLETEFVFGCTSWIDPEDTTHRSFLTYTFMYRKMGDDAYPSSLTKIQTDQEKLETKPLTLPGGIEAFGFDIEILVTVTDEAGGYNTVVFKIQVQPVQISVDELLGDGKLDSLAASSDPLAIFTFISAADSLVSEEEDVYYSSEDIKDKEETYDAFVAARDKFVSTILTVVESGLQDKDSVKQAAQTMESMAARPDTLSDNAKANTAKILDNILESQLKVAGDTTTEEQHVVATMVLSTMTSIQNTSRVDAECPGPKPVTEDVSPAVKLEMEATRKAKAEAKCAEMRKTSQAINGQLQKTLTKVKMAIFVSAVPGEAAFNFTTDEMEMTAFVVESSKLLAAELKVDGGGFDLPEMGDSKVAENCGVEMISLKSNDYAFDDTAKQVKSKIQALTLSDDKGNDLEIKNLAKPVSIRFENSPEKSSTPQTIVYTKDTVEPIGPMYYHQVSVTDPGLTIAVIVTSLDGADGYDYYVQVNSPPNLTSYDDFGVLPKGKYKDERDWTIMFDTKPHEDEFDTNGTLYIGIMPKNFTEGKAEFNMSMFAPACVYFDPDTSSWSGEGCRISEDTSQKETICLCNHLTMFASNWIVPPNTIDFSTVFDNGAEKLLENIHVFATMIGILVLYLILVIIMRRYDKRDVLKWGIAPFTDNAVGDSYHYHVTVHTGMRSGSGTTSNVFLMLGGENCDSEVRKVEDTLDRPLSRGSVNNYLLSVREELGPLMYLRIWHDNSGKSGKASWLLDRVVVRDIQTNIVYVFLAQRWLGVDKEDGQIEVLLPAASEKDLANFQFLFSSTTREDMSDGHLWFSLVSRPTRSRFTRVQRLSCCLALLFATMIANAMWYRTEENVDNVQVVRMGPFSFTPQQVFISISSSLVSVPISIIIVTLFRKAGPKPIKRKLQRKGSGFKYVPKTPRAPSTVSKKVSDDDKHFMGEELNELVDFDDDPNITPKIARVEDVSDIQFGTTKEKKKKKPFMLPWWITYVAWALVFLTVAASGTFTMLYSFEWGREKSSEWLTAFVLSFLQSIVVIQPVKVLGIAVFLALVIKKPKVGVDPAEDEETEYELYEAQAHSVQHRDKTSKPEHRLPYKKQAINEADLEKLRLAREKEVKMWSILREIFSYMLYILVISTLTYDNKDIRSFQSKEELNRIFVEGSLAKIKTKAEFWDWTNTTLLPNMYAKYWYNSEEVHWNIQYFTGNMIYYRIGAPRLRLARIKNGTCRVEQSMQEFVSNCYDTYGLSTYDEAHYGEGWSALNGPVGNGTETEHNPWLYRDTMELDGVPVMGNLGTYGGGGYVADLGTEPEVAANTLDYLKRNRWLDRRSRAVFVEFNLFNPNTNLFSIVNLVVEFPASGGVVLYPLIQTLRLYNYVGGRALFRLLLDIFFIIFTLYFFVTEVKKMKKEKRSYFKSFWNIMEVLNIIGAFSGFALYAVHYAFTRMTIKTFHSNKDKFTNFQYILNWDDIFGYVLGFLVFISMIKLLKLLRFNKKVTELMTTLDVATKPLLGFFIFFTIIYVAFAQFAFMVFGTLLENYSTFISTLESMFSMMLMNFHYDELHEANPVLGPAFFLLFVLVLAFVIINMLVSILNESFALVKARDMLNNSDYEMVDYIMKQFKSLISVGGGDAPNVDVSKNGKTSTVQAKPSYVNDVPQDTLPAIRYDAWQKKAAALEPYNNLRDIPSTLGHYDLTLNLKTECTYKSKSKF